MLCDSFSLYSLGEYNETQMIPGSLFQFWLKQQHLEFGTRVLYIMFQ